MTLLEFIQWYYQQYCPLAGTYVGELIYWLVLHTSWAFFGSFFQEANGLAANWAIVLDNLVDQLGIPKIDH